MVSASFPLFLILKHAHEVGIVTMIEEAVEPDLESSEGEEILIGGEATIAIEHFPLETDRPAEASDVRSGFLATPAKFLITFNFLHFYSSVSFSKSHSL
jgi:hypothetical protein